MSEHLIKKMPHIIPIKGSIEYLDKTREQLQVPQQSTTSIVSFGIMYVIRQVLKDNCST